MFPAASNLIPFDIPLGDRKIVVLLVAGSNFQMCPASIAPCSSRDLCENVISLKYTIPSGATLTPSVSTCDSNSFSSFASGGTIGSSACSQPDKQSNPMTDRQPRYEGEWRHERFSMTGSFESMGDIFVGRLCYSSAIQRPRENRAGGVYTPSAGSSCDDESGTVIRCAEAPIWLGSRGGRKRPG